MSDQPTNPWMEAAVGLAAVLICGLVYLATLGLPPPKYDPLGPAAAPKILCMLIGGLGAVVLARALIAIRKAGRPVAVPVAWRRIGIAAGVMAATVAYVVTLATAALRYSEATLIFLVAAGALMTGGRPRSLLQLAGIGLILGYGGRYLFTQVFFVDLP